ncbi:hypothetical protein N0V88_005387 [Collariella sp. IMI 366227]|nr:hypothetical protein N0V88_005387 [Collariella sp. IMI 366227]
MASCPSAPLNHDPHDEADFRFRTNGTACEWGESYHPGSYHYIRLGDSLHDRCRITRKLGYGCFSTVWLAADTASKSFIAVKVTTADSPTEAINKSVAVYRALPKTETPYAVGLYDVFEILGPNGRHAYFALEPMGPHLTDLLQDPARHAAWPPLLHVHGIVHGDLHLGNILGNIQPLGKPSEGGARDQILEQDASERVTLERLNGKVDLWAPAYLVEPAPLHDQVSFELDPVVRLADLGAAFFDGHPPKKVVTPVVLRAPEVILGVKRTRRTKQ